MEVDMTKVMCLAGLLAGCAAILSSGAQAGPVPGFKHGPGIVHPENDFASRRSGGLANEWMFRRDWQPIAQSYGAALKFANCVAKYSPAAGEGNLAMAARDPKVRADLVYLVRCHRACAAEQAVLAPVLLRAAFAEVALRSMEAPRVPGDIGLPGRIGTFPLAAVADCQFQAAPELAAELLRTSPGDAAEEDAATRLFAATRRCSVNARASITPTAARLAVVDAAFRRFAIGQD
jgi:hypothetical protein